MKPKYVLVRIEGTPVQVDEVILDFRGDKYTYKYISQAPGQGSSGKIIVERNGVSRELFPSVFRCVIIELMDGTSVS